MHLCLIQTPWGFAPASVWIEVALAAVSILQDMSAQGFTKCSVGSFSEILPENDLKEQRCSLYCPYTVGGIQKKGWGEGNGKKEIIKTYSRVKKRG